MPECRDCQNPADRLRHQVKHCVGNEIRGTVDWDSIPNDLALVYDHARAHPDIDPDRIVVLVHSEGVVHTARLISDQRINPLGLVLLARPAESPRNTVRWQWASRAATGFLEQVGGAGSQAVSNEGIAGWCREQGMPDASCEQFMAPNEGWSDSTLTETMKGREFETMKESWLSLPGEDPYAHHLAEAGGVFASMNWWQGWLSDHTPVVDRLKSYEGAISVVLGDTDAVVPLDRQRDFYENLARSQPDTFELVVMPGKVHALGSNAVSGPMSEQAKLRVTETIRTMLEINKPDS
ncbi:hypothetical protein IC757_03680 [Wenzhouxiangella sp. AB-CW3]|uniref:hypothetical protein n=1 Tax=Wenzhouxiangella sp. AB-CW3 TaxID=2771012 RepID=UPI00168BDA01|nr:hypothetical protein [Wenzhouxiangella sp. AB-CW3]QOC23263.1 hypothetical protein IC757_03680 [Wenzhouxiangella sp. AB-CW3]